MTISLDAAFSFIAYCGACRFVGDACYTRIVTLGRNYGWAVAMAVKEIKDGKRRLTVTITDDLYRRLGREAYERNVTVNELMARIAEEAVRKK